jgi:cysteine desulfurase
MDSARYFDNAATTRIDPRVLQEMLPWLGEHFGNANSMHLWGRRAMAAVDLARERCQRLVGAEDACEIIFTSGASESNNWVLQHSGRFAVSPFEHSSVRAPAMDLPQGSILGNDGWTIKPPEEGTDLISVMKVNSEIGAVIDLPDSNEALIHSDITQGAGKVPVTVEGMHYASFSSHKIYGPKGVGALYIEGGYELEPLLLGGGQEQGLRAGTLNVPAIVGFGAAAAAARDDVEDNRAHVTRLREIVWEEVSKVKDVRRNDHTNQSPFTMSLSFAGLQGETLVIEMDAQGYAISAGSACSSGSKKPSEVLSAMGMTEEWSRGTARVSFSKINTPDSAQEMGKTLAKTAERLRSLQPA